MSGSQIEVWDDKEKTTIKEAVVFLNLIQNPEIYNKSHYCDLNLFVVFWYELFIHGVDKKFASIVE